MSEEHKQDPRTLDWEAVPYSFEPVYVPWNIWIYIRDYLIY
jgi:hypothetical protein